MKKLNEKKNENYDFVLKQKIVEALIFSSSDPVPYDELLKRIIDKNILNEILENLEKKYSSSGVNLYVINNSYAFRTSLDVSELLNIEKIVPKPLSRAATETLAMRVIDVVEGTETDNFPEFIVKFNVGVHAYDNSLGV